MAEQNIVPFNAAIIIMIYDRISESFMQSISVNFSRFAKLVSDFLLCFTAEQWIVFLVL